MIRKKAIAVVLSAGLLCCLPESRAAVDTRREAELKYKTTSQAAGELYMQRRPSVENLIPEITLGLTEGFDSNVNLDPSKKSDSYIEESLDARYTYPIKDDSLDVKFGFDIVNSTYYNITDASLFDGSAYVNLEGKMPNDLTFIGGYAFNTVWYPNDENGTYISNEVSGGYKHYITSRVYQKAMYRFSLKNYIDKKRRLGNAEFSSERRADLRQVLEHEVAVYIFENVKLKITNQFLVNDSNDQYFDYYDYSQYKFGPSMTVSLMDKLYNISSFSLVHREYAGRRASGKNSRQKDDLYIASTSLLYDITKVISVYATYSYRENRSTETLDKYSSSIFATGLYYSF